MRKVQLSILIEKEFLRFLLIGSACFAVDYVVYAVFLKFAPLSKEITIPYPQLFGHFLGSALGFFLSFSLNRIWVFKSNGKLIPQLLKYSSLYAFNLLVSSTILYLLISVLKTDSHLAKFTVIVFITIWNFFMYKLFVYKAISLPRLFSSFSFGKG